MSNQRRDVLVRYGVIDSPRLCRAPESFQLFYRNLLHLGDKNARFIADAADIRLDLYRHALDRVKIHHVQQWLQQCVQLNLVKLYTRSGKTYGQILNYGQRDTKRRALHPVAEDEPELMLEAPEPTPATAPPKGSEVKIEVSRARASDQINREANRTLPAGLDTPGFRAAWEAWLQHWSEAFNRASPMPSATADRHLRLLVTLGPVRALVAMENAISRGLREPAEPFAQNFTHGNNQSGNSRSFEQRNDYSKFDR